MKARVFVTLKPGVLDPQGKAIHHALEGLGFSGVQEVRAGKLIELDLADGTTDDDIADMDSNAHPDVPIGRHVSVGLRHRPLNGGRAFDRIHGAGELRQQAVAHQLEDASAMGADERLDQFRAPLAQALEGPSSSFSMRRL